jgi:hypothetical protein
MSKEEPAWKAELEGRIADLFRVKDNALPEWTRMTRTADALGALIVDLVAPHILAAEQRGFQAGVNKTGDSVGKLRAKLAAVREELENPLLHTRDPERQGERWLAQRVRSIVNAPDAP